MHIAKKHTNKNNWYVITGGPSAGKTTVLTELFNRGYTVIPEAARLHIDNGIKKGLTLAQIRKDEIAFQKAVLNLKIETEEKLSKNEITFFDRAIPDTIAYYEWQNKPITSALKKLVKRCSYKTVFLFELLEYVSDYARVETTADAQRLEKLLKKTYESIGLSVVIVPQMTVSQRVAFVEDYIKKKN